MALHEIWDDVGDGGGWDFMLVIAGAGTTNPVRYYSGAAPAADTDPRSGQAYVDVPAIVHVGDEVATIRPSGGIAEYQPVVVRLACQLYPTIHDAGVVLDRNGYQHAAHWTRLLTTIESSWVAPSAVEVIHDPAAWTIPGPIHVGRETMWSTGIAGTGAAGDPWRFTGITRGIWGTKPLVHFVGGLEAHRPFVADRKFTWENTRVLLYWARRRLDGSRSEWGQCWRGLLKSPPIVAGAHATVEITSMIGAIERRISPDGRYVGLHPRKHYFEGSAAVTVQMEQHFAEAAAFDVVTNVATLPGFTPIQGPTAPHAGAFDITLPSGHPRKGVIRIVGQTNASVEPTAYSVFPVGYTVPGAASPGAAIGDHIRNAPCSELIKISLVTPERGQVALLDWPKAVFDAVNIATGWGNTIRDGVGGQWARVLVSNDAEAGPRLLVTYNPTAAGDPLRRAGPLRLRFWAGSDGRPTSPAGRAPRRGEWGPLPNDWRSGVPEPPANSMEALHYALDLAEPSDTRHVPPFARFESQNGGYSLHGGEGGWTREVVVARNTDVDALPVPIRGLCTRGWRQVMELWITLNSPLVLTTLGHLWIRVQYVDRATGQQSSAVMRIVEVLELVVGEVWAARLDEASRFTAPSFGDWPGMTPVKIAPTVKFQPMQPTTVMLQALLSTGGGGVGHAALDTQPFGAELHEEDVDLDSFARFAEPPGLDHWSPAVPADGIELDKLIEPMLRVMGCSVVMKRNEQGQCRITLVATGLPNAADVVTSLDDTHFQLAEVPGTRVDHKITNTRQYLTDHADGGEGKPQIDVTYHDGASKSAHGAGGKEKLDLRGVYLGGDAGVPEILAALQDAESRLATMDGWPRKLWKASTKSAKGALLHVAGATAVTSRFLKGYSDSPGVAGALARITSYRLKLWGGDGCELKMTHFGNRSVSWNWAAEVTAIVDAITVEVAPNVYTVTVHPVTGAAADDLTGLEVGDKLGAVPFGADDTARPVLNVVAIDRVLRRVTLSAAHGLVAPALGWLVPATYTSAAAGHQRHAWLATVQGLLGAGEQGNALT